MVFKCQNCRETYADISNMTRRNCQCEEYTCKGCFYFYNFEICKCGVTCKDEMINKKFLQQQIDNSNKGYIYGNYSAFELDYLSFYLNKKHPGYVIRNDNNFYQKIMFNTFGSEYAVSFKICRQ